MTHLTEPHLTDDRIVDVALGADVQSAERGHLATCADCRSAVDGFTDTVALTRSLDSDLLVAPPDRVWQAIEAELGTAPATTAGRTGTVQSIPTDPQRRAHSFRAEDSASHDASVTSLSDRRSRGRQAALPAVWLLAAACVLGIVLGVGGASLADRLGTTPEPTETTVATTDLAPLDSPTTQGRAELVDRTDGLGLSVSTAEIDPGEGYLEVWLINRDLTRMISVGVLPGDATEIVLPVSQDLIDQGYVIVDISREQFDDQPQHSGDTVVRGELPV